MTDPFSDLERELLAAHGRDLRRGFARRGLGAARRPTLALASAAVLAAAFVALANVAAPGDAERAAAPGQVNPATCDSPFIPPATSDPVPQEIAQVMSVFRTGAESSAPAGWDDHLFGTQAVRTYGHPHRLGPAVSGDVYAVAADILPRSGTTSDREICSAPAGDVVPGVCLAVVNAKGALSACFTVEEIENAAAYIDSNTEVVGLAPDGPTGIEFTSATCHLVGDIHGNAFHIGIPSGSGSIHEATSRFLPQEFTVIR